MAKDYRKWHILKQEIERKGRIPVFYEREIWWCSLGTNVGVETDGKNSLFERPVIVLHRFNRHMFWALPLTSKVKESPYHFSLMILGVKRSVLLSQLRAMSSYRLSRKIAKISNDDYEKLQQIIINQIKRTPERGSPSPCGIMRYACAYLTILLRGLRRLAALIR